MAITPGNVLIGSGTISAYIDTAAGTTYAYTDLGGYRDGVTITFSEDRVNVESQDSLGFVKSIRSRLECTITTTLLESTFDNLNTLLIGNGTNATSIKIDADPTPGGNAQTAFPLKFVGDSDDGDFKTIIFSSVVPVLDGDITFSKDSELLVPATFVALAVNDSGWGFGNIANT
jgi:hypothetical protein